ncbi:hypothetical protein VTL71DRAFT_13090 [Oculimacula yallundae]|uniref:Uncharacterized protein n=1 Tax=Oculimacula yallundae TaxID=86028 RepID=A0ABR4CPF9_9HELO
MSKNCSGKLITPHSLSHFFPSNTNSYAPFPWPGTIRRLPVNWPSPSTHKTPAKEDPTEEQRQNFKTVLIKPQFQQIMYAEYGEFRDIDYRHLAGIVDLFLVRASRLTRDVVERVVNWIVRDDGDNGRINGIIGLGPEGIARMMFELTDAIRDDCQSDFTRDKLAQDETICQEAIDAESKRALVAVEDQLNSSGVDSGVAFDSSELGRTLETVDDPLDSSGVDSGVAFNTSGMFSV